MVRFIDTFPVSFADDADFESKHKRDDDGKFTSGKSSIGKSNLEKLVKNADGKDISKTPRLKPVSYWLDEIMRAEDSSLSLRNMMKAELQGGFINCNLKHEGPSKLVFSASTIDEIVSKFKHEIPRDLTEGKKYLERLTIAIYSVDHLVKHGSQLEWVGSYKKKHGESAFLHIVGVLKDLEGKKFPSQVIIKKNEFGHTKPHLIRAKGNAMRNSLLMQKKQRKMFVDDERKVFEIVSMQI